MMLSRLIFSGLPVAFLFLLNCSSAKRPTANVEERYREQCEICKQNSYCGSRSQRRDVNCGQVARTFIHSFEYQDPCPESDATDYNDLLDIISLDVDGEKTMFYSSGMKTVANSYAIFKKGNYRTLEMTFAGASADGLHWCGSLSGLVSHEQDCRECLGSGSTVDLHLKTICKKFAVQANGAVFAVLSATGEKSPYHKDSIFRTIEVPDLQASRVSNFTVWLANPRPGVQDCHSGSLIDLKNDMKSKGIDYYCDTAPDELMQFAYLEFNNGRRSGAHTIFSSITIILLTSVVLWLIAYVTRHVKRSHNSSHHNQEKSDVSRDTKKKL